MKKLITGILLTLFLAGCNFTDLSKETDLRLKEKTAEEIQQSTTEKVKHELLGCEFAQKNIKERTGQNYNCEQSNAIDNHAAEAALFVAFGLNFAVIVGFFAVLIYAYIAVGEVSTGGKLKEDPTNRTTHLKRIFFIIIGAVLLVPVSFHKVNDTIDFPMSTFTLITYNVIFDSWDEIETSQAELEATKRYRFPIQEIPRLDAKSHQFAKVLQYQICVNATGRTEPVDYSIYLTETGVAAKSNYKQCELNLNYAYDAYGIEVAEKYGLADYKQAQQQEAQRIIKMVLDQGQVYANNFAAGYNRNDLIKMDFDNNVSCTELNTVDSGLLGTVGKTSYLMKASECLSETFVKETNKFPGLDFAYLDKGNHLKNRQLEFCVHDYSGDFKVHNYKWSEGEKIAKQCYQQACSFGDGDKGSLAQCGTALTVYDFFQHKKNMKGQDMFLSLVRADDNIPVNSNDNGKVFANSFSAEFLKNDTTFEYKPVDNVISTITAQGYAGSERIGMLNYVLYFESYWSNDNLNFFNAEWKLPTMTDLKGMVAGNDGVYGIERLLSCLPHANYYNNGYICYSSMQEFAMFGKKNIKAAVDGFMFSLIRNTKMSSVKNGAVGEAKKTFVGSILKNKYVWAGVLFGVGNNMTDSIYGPETDNTKWSAENWPLYVALLYVPEFYTFYQIYFSSVLLVGVFFTFVVPALAIFNGLRAFGEQIIGILFHQIIAPTQFTASIGNEDMAKKSIDIIDPIIKVFLFGMSFTLIYLGVIYSSVVLDTIFYGIGYVVDLTQFGQIMLASTSGNLSEQNLIVEASGYLVILLVIFFILKLCYSMIYNIPKQGIAMFAGERVRTELDDEEDNFYRTYAAKLKI